jgi:hypothetical protein
VATATQIEIKRNLQNRCVIEERGLRVLENRLLTELCGPKRDQVTVGWRKWHKEELRDFLLLAKYCSDHIKRNYTG